MSSAVPTRAAVVFCILFTGAALLALLGCVAYLGLHDGADFVSFYTAGAIIRDGRAPILYDIGVQAAYQRFLFQRPTPLPFYHPAFEALIFAPLSLLSFTTAYLLWAVINIACLMCIPFLLRPYIRVPANILGLSLLCFLFFSIWVSLIQGQDSIILLLLYVLAFRKLKQGKDGLAGALLACGLFKFQLVIPAVLILAVYRGRRFALGFSATAFFLAGISTAMTGGIRPYISFLLSSNRNLAFDTIKPSIMPNVRGLLATVAAGLPGVNVFIGVVSLLILVAAVGMVIFKKEILERNGVEGIDLVYTLAMLTTILTSYHLNPHDLSLLLLPILLLMELLVWKPNFAAKPARLLLIGVLLLLYQPITYLLLVRRGQMHKGVFLVLIVWAVVLHAIFRTRYPDGKDSGSVTAAV